MKMEVESRLLSHAGRGVTSENEPMDDTRQTRAGEEYQWQ